MDEQPGNSVLIEFETPAGDLSPYHQRSLSGVPTSIAKKMAADFEAYGSSETKISPHKLYCYEDEEGEGQLIALDFTEITDVRVQAGNGGSSANDSPSANGMPSTNGRASADG